jgi:hypothetical protein
MSQTTNGIGMFDEAIISRIHLTIPYLRANEVTRRDIWKTLFEKLKADQDKRNQAERATGDGKTTQPRITVDEDTRLRFSVLATDVDKELQLNGREIRNSKLSPSVSKMFLSS